jgi:cytochrome c peroxidase
MRLAGFARVCRVCIQEAIRMKSFRYIFGATSALFSVVLLASVSAQGGSIGNRQDGKRVFDKETFGGNGRTCATCHTEETGTVSPEDARRRFKTNPKDPLFLHDGSDDGQGHGVSRMLKDATVLVEIPLPANVSLADDPEARSVILRRGIPTTIDTPALDPVLMLDGRQPDLESQAAGAIHDHAQGLVLPSGKDLRRLAEFQLTDRFFSSPELQRFAMGGPAPTLPQGRTASEKRGRRFFENIPPNPADFPEGLKDGLCSACHSGPLLNEANEFLQIVVPGAHKGTRFQTVGVSEFNALDNPVRPFVFTNADGSQTTVLSPDPGRALITGIAPNDDPTFENVNAFKISPLRGIRRTAPYFHDNSAKTLEDVVRHYANFFNVVTNGVIVLSDQDQADIVAFLKLL